MRGPCDGKPLDEVEKARFGGAVHRTRAVALKPGHGTENDDDAGLLRNHLRHQRPRKIDGAFEVHVQSPVDHLYRLFVKGNHAVQAASLVSSGTRHKTIGASQLFSLGGNLHCIAEIADIPLHGDSGPADGFGLRFQHRFVDVTHDDLRAEPYKFFRRIKPHSACGACHYDKLAAKFNLFHYR